MSGVIDQVASDALPQPVTRTCLIADIRGYTQFTNEHGTEAAARLADVFATLCKTVLAKSGGQVVELRGDEALCVFESPASCVLTAIALQHEFQSRAHADASLPLRVGIGIDQGELVAVHGGYRGRALNLAARLCALAGPGETFSSEQVIQDAGRIAGLAYVERGRVQLKGFEDPVRVIHVLPQGDLPANFPPLISLVAKPSNLPVQTTTFVGREREVREICELVLRAGVRLVTLTGAGGTGKTRLSLQVGAAVLEQFERGVYFVDLTSLADPAHVADTVASTFRIREVAGQTVLDVLVDHLQPRHLLLVLDNFEHLLPAGRVVHELLTRCPRLSILVTSQALLHLSSEQEYRVPPLALPEAGAAPSLEDLLRSESVALFIERARAVRPAFAPTHENVAQVALICQKLEGLPLAIELAAARIKLLSPAELMKRLDRRLSLLVGGAADRPSRQRTLRGAIDWSYSLLSTGEKRLLAHLSVFAGGYTLEAAEAVCASASDVDVVDAVTSLLDKSLLRQDHAETPRFVMLEAIKEYAAEQLRGFGEEDRVRSSHADYFVRLALETEPHLAGAEQDMHLRRLHLELQNIRAAFRTLAECGRSQDELRLANALWQFCIVRGHYSEGRQWLEGALSRAPTATESLRASALVRAGSLAMQLCDYEVAQRLTEEGLALRRRLGDKPGVASALNNLGTLAESKGDLRTARRLIEESLVHYREIADPDGTSMALVNLSTIAMKQGASETAADALEEALACCRRSGNLHRQVHVLAALATLDRHRGNLPAAQDRFLVALELSEQLEEARLIAHCLNNLGMLAALQGDPERAVGCLERSLARYEQVGDRGGIAGVIGNLATVALDAGAYDEAERRLGQCLDVFIEIGAKLDVLEALEHLGFAAFGKGRFKRAVCLYGSAQAGRDALGFTLTADAEEAFSRRLAKSRAMLAPTEWQQAWSDGSAMTLEAAVALAREVKSRSDGG